MTSKKHASTDTQKDPTVTTKAPKKHASETTTQTEGSHAMKIQTHATPTVTENHTTVATTNEKESAPMKTTTTASTSATTTAASPVSAEPIAYVKAPPPITLPPLPGGIYAAPSADLRALLPRKAELALMPDAKGEIGRITDYTGVFGKVAPSQAVVMQTFDVAYQWSLLGAALEAWVEYADAQEVAAWMGVRNLVVRLGPAFSLAVMGDATLGEECPSLRQLLGVRKAIAARGAAARQANKKEEAAGQPAYKGKAGKRRKRADEVAALEAQQASAKAPPAAAGTQASAPVRPVPAGNGSEAGPAPVAETTQPGGVGPVVVAPVAPAGTTHS